MLKSPGFVLKIAALGLVLVGLIFILGMPSQPVDPTAPALPTQTIASTETQSPPIDRTAVPATDVPQASPLPPTALPTAANEVIALQPTLVLPTATVQPPPTSEPILQPVPQQPVPNQVTIQFAPNTSREQQQVYIQSLGGQIETTITPLNTVVVSLPDTSEALLASSPLVLQAEPDYYVRAQQSTPNDPFYSQQWAFPVIKAAEAWPLLPANTPTIVVAVIDSGICAAHPDLTGRILPGYDYVQDDSNPQDEYGHGCEVAGVIAANANNGMGVAGVAPNTHIMPLRVLDAAGNGYTSDVAAAITYATDNGAAIINLSLGGPNASATMETAVNYAVSHGVLVIAAAGNTGETVNTNVIYPAAYTNVVAVASIDQNLQRSSFSSFGPEVDLLAPGRNILTTKLNGTYGYASGTSFAAPQVTGIAALEMAQGRTLTQGGGIAQVYVPRPEATNTWAVILDAGSDPNTVAAQLGYENLGQIGTLENTYLFRAVNSELSVQSAQTTANTLQASSQIIWFEQQYAEQYYTRTPDDEPLYTLGPSEQWHLRNGEQNTVSLNMPESWVNGTTTGAGVQIAIVDDGLQYTHPDLAPNYNPTGSCDYNDSTPPNTANCNEFNPAADTVGACGSAADCHGTAAAGVAAGADNPAPTYPDDWDFCGVGVAYGAQISGIRILSAYNTAAQRAAALTFRYDVNDIYNNSWGPLDNGAELGFLDPLIRDSLEDGITNGRNQLGSIYVWAAGNGRANGDNINADGYANSRYVIAVGATNHTGNFASYSEPGAPMLVVAPSSGAGRGIATTDLIGTNGYNKGESGANDYSFIDTFSENYSCTKTFSGTSAAAPMVSGVVALMLQANPNLTWRDVQHILVNTARKNNVVNSDWTVNGAGKNINHNYGFGLVDAAAAVSAAQTWTNVGPELQAETAVVTVNQPIPDSNSTGVTSSVALDANIYIEHVEVIFNATHPSRGQLEVTLTSPDGTQSRLMERRVNDTSGVGYVNWSFSSVRHWGEHSAGTWTLKVNDAQSPQTGNFQNWKLVVYGTVAPPKPPAPTAPAYDVTIFTPLPWNTTTFTWDNFSAAHHLELQLDIVDPPVAAPIFIDGTPDSYVMNLPLGTYFWRVRAVDEDSATAEPDWVDIPLRTFTLATSETLAPVRNYFQIESPTLTWKEISWATAYQIEISTSDTFAAGSTVYLTPPGTPISATEQSFLVDPPLGEGRYYWRVRARKADGTWNTTWSIIDSFIIDLPPN